MEMLEEGWSMEETNFPTKVHWNAIQKGNNHSMKYLNTE
jgi:hypothetical protein